MSGRLPALVEALSAHAHTTGPISGSWKCPAPCRESSPASIAGVLATKAERLASLVAHQAAVAEGCLK